jgi:hypothetical protein
MGFLADKQITTSGMAKNEKWRNTLCYTTFLFIDSVWPDAIT